MPVGAPLAALGLEVTLDSHKIQPHSNGPEDDMSDTTGRSPRWMPATGDHSDRQLHAMEFIASSLDRIDGHLERIAASLAGSGAHKPFGEALGEQLRALGDAIGRMGRRT
jgi:hypothetical protein